jgi:hypothetical protein
MVGVPAKQRSALDQRQQVELGAISGRYTGVQANYRRMLQELAEQEGDSQ